MDRQRKTRAEGSGCTSTADAPRGPVVHRSVEIAGVVYKSMAAASRALNVRPDTLQRRLKLRADPKKRMNARPVTIDGRHYATTADAARALGISHQALQQRLDYKRRRKHQRYRARVTTIDGISYPSLSAACRVLGISRSRATARARNGGQHESRMTADPRLPSGAAGRTRT
jgi:prophage antirepressor-like protein